MKRTMMAVALAALAAVLPAQKGVLVTFGLISDTHVCDKADQSSAISLNASPRYFSGGIAKLEAFGRAMNEAKADFVAELGDFTDNPADASLDASARRAATTGFLKAAEAAYASYKGPRYHVLGNHDTDQSGKEDFLAIAKSTGVAPGATYYSFDKGGAHFIVLDMSFKADGAPYSGVPGTPGAGYSWDDANLPAAELAWLKADLAAASAPVIVLTHQELNPQELVDAAFDPKHAARNAAQVRSILESSKKVLCVFSGHYHDGGCQEVNGIRYIVLQANAAYGNDSSYHNQYALVKVVDEGGRYTVAVAGNGIQRSYAFTKDMR